MLEINKIYCMDAIKFLHQFPDKSIDLILTDPPYGIGESNEKNSTRGHLAKPTDFGHYDWDKKLPKKYFDEMLRTSRNQIIFGGNYYANYLPPSSCWLVWDKDNGSNDFADCELAWTSFTSAVRKFKWRWNGILQEDMKRKEKRLHPTQKPVALFKWILKKYTKENDLIVDPFIGSGTTAIACIETSRNFIGCDINQRYINIANSRLFQKRLNQV